MAHVLAVDDSVSLRRLLASTLASAGHEVVEAGNGADALAALKTHSFNLIISDLNMPVMDGLTFIKKVRMIAAFRFTPILILTTEMDQGKKREAKEPGATGWVVKAFDPVPPPATVREVLG